MSMLLLMLLSLMALFFVWGFMVARRRGRSAILWGVVCALTFFIGIAILYSLGDGAPAQRPAMLTDQAADDQPPMTLALTAAPTPPARTAVLQRLATSETGETAEDRRWRYLCTYHPQLRTAIADAELLGEDALHELKLAYLALNDAALLPAIMERLDERFGPPPRRREAIAAPVKTSGYDASMDADEPILLGRVSPPAAANGADPMRSRPLFEHEPAAEPVRVFNGLAKDKPPVERPASDRLSRDVPVRDRPPHDGLRAFDPASMHKAPDRVQQAALVSPNFVETGYDLQSSVFVTTMPAKSAPIQSVAELLAAPAQSALLQQAGAGILADDAEDLSEQHTETHLDSIDAEPHEEDTFDDAALNGAHPPERTPERTNVTPEDLAGARFVETYAGVHLFALVDGRVFIDRHEARPSLLTARSFVDQVGSKRSSL